MSTIICSDLHIGRGKKSQVVYRGGFEKAFEYIIDSLSPLKAEPYNAFQTKNNLIVAGDLFEKANPSPSEYRIVLNGVSYLRSELLNFIIFPGNHDYILSDGYSAVDVLETYYVFRRDNNDSRYFITYHDYDKVVYHIVPFSHDMGDVIKNIVIPEHLKDKLHYLVSHFSTIQMSPYAGIFDETDPMFDKFDKVIVGDYHAAYENGKFITCGSTFYWNVDEMLNNKPSYLVVDDHTGEITREYVKNIPEVVIIANEEEAVDDTKLYVIVDNVISTKPNVFIKNKKIDEDIINACDYVESKPTTVDTLLDEALNSIPNKDIKSSVIGYIKDTKTEEEINIVLERTEVNE